VAEPGRRKEDGGPKLSHCGHACPPGTRGGRAVSAVRHVLARARRRSARLTCEMLRVEQCALHTSVGGGDGP